MIKNINRRRLLAGALAPWLSVVGGCNREINPNFAAPSPSPEVLEIRAQDERVAKRLGLGNRGHEVHVDAVDGEEFNDLEIFYFNTSITYYQCAGQKITNRGSFSVSGPPPEKLRVIWRDRYEKIYDDSNMVVSAGKIIGEEVIEVASRIPQTLLDDLRRDPKGNLRIKIRLHPEGVLLGWDIERRPGFNVQKSREGQYYPPAYSQTGGDFKEMRIAYYIDAKSHCQECVAFARNVKKTPYVVYSDDPNGYITMPSADDLQNQLPEVLRKNGYFLTPIGEVYSSYGSGRQLREKGWYIHPKTGQRFETDF